MNIVGGYRFPNAPAIDLSPIKTEVVVTPRTSAPVTYDDLDIPDFLRRIS
jgi:hypothetical protein